MKFGTALRALEQTDFEKLGALRKCQSLDEWSLNLLGLLWEAEVERQAVSL